MKFSCLRENLIDKLPIVEKVTGKNLTLPVLSNILIVAENNTLIFRATNLDLGIEVIIPVKIEQNGAAAVPGSVLYNIISNINNNDIKFETVNNNLFISTKTNKTIIKTQPYEDFPTIPNPKRKQSFSIRTNQILSGLTSVWYSASESTIKPELSSVYIYNIGEKIVFVSTDSFRLAEKTITPDKLIEFEPIIIPIKNIQTIIRIIEKFDGDAEVNISENQISFVLDKTYLTSRLINGVFPDYRQIIQKNHTTEVVLLKHDLLNSLKKANIFSDKFNQVRFNIKPSKKNFTIYSKNTDVGETNDIVGAALSGDDLDISFNLKYIIDSLQSINSDSVSLTFNGLSKPMIIKGVSDNSFLYLVMPMNK